MHGTVRGLFKLLGAFGTVSILLAAWLAYRVSEGPLSLSPLTPYIETALSRPSDDIAVKLQDTILAWSRDTKSLEIEGVAVRVIKGGTTIASFPEMSVRLSGTALWHGKLVPRSIRLMHPALRLLLDENGEFSFGVGASDNDQDTSNIAVADGGGTAVADGGGTAVADVGIAALLAPPGRESLAGQLQSIQVVAGSVALEDRRRGLSWTAPRADLTFARDNRGIAVRARLDLLLDGQNGHIDADGLYLNQERSLDLSLSGGGIRPSSLARLSPQLDFLSAVQFPIGGSVALHYRPGEGITGLTADVAAGEGVLDLTPVAGFSIPVRAVELKAVYQSDQLTLKGLRVDLGGAILTADGTVENLSGPMKMALHFQSDGIALDALPSLWPKPVASHPRAWMAANMSHGGIKAIEGILTGHVGAGQGLGELAIDQLNGTMTVEDATVRYMPTMPKVNHVAAAVRFDADSFTIDMTGGEAANLSLPEGQVLLKGLSKPDQDAVINLKIAGTVADVLRFIDNPPLGWTSKFNIDPAQLKGAAVLHLSLSFPLVEDLSLDKLSIKVEADNKGFFMPHVLRDIDLSDGDIHISVDNDGLDAVGTAQIDNRPATIRWRENFDKAAFRSRYQIAAVLSDDGRKLAGLGASPFQPPYMHGAMPMDLTATMVQPGDWDIAVKADLAGVELALPGLNYVKAAEVKGQAAAELQLIDNKLAKMPRFHVAAEGNLDVAGDAVFDKDGELRRITLQKAAFARSDLSGSITFRAIDGGMTVAVSGGSFDAREIVADRPSDPVTDRETPRPPPAPRAPAAAKEVTPLVIQGRFERVWLSDSGWVTNVAADLLRNNRDQWRRAHILAEVGDHQSFALDLNPTDDRHSSLVIESSDGGAVFRAMDVFGTMQGGKLNLNAVYDDSVLSRPLTGKLDVKDFQLVDAPVLAKLLTVAGLTGIVDLLTGQGIHFNGLEMPFSYQDGILQVSDGQASGSALGITAKGRVDLDSNRLNLEGTVVPAYAINSALGGLPLVGGLFTAEKGGGFLAINYHAEGPMSDPTVIPNPLSALTPGFLRHLFDIFGSSADQPKK